MSNQDDKVVYDHLSSDDEVNTFDCNDYMEQLKKNLDSGLCSASESWNGASASGSIFGFEATQQPFAIKLQMVDIIDVESSSTPKENPNKDRLMDSPCFPKVIDRCKTSNSVVEMSILGKKKVCEGCASLE